MFDTTSLDALVGFAAVIFSFHNPLSTSCVEHIARAPHTRVGIIHCVRRSSHIFAPHPIRQSRGESVRRHLSARTECGEALLEK